jgi:hypothetical protein
MWRGRNGFVAFGQEQSPGYWRSVASCNGRSCHLRWACYSPTPDREPTSLIELQNELSFVIWLLLAILSAWIASSNAVCLKLASALVRFFRKSIEGLQINPHHLSRNLGTVFVAGLVLFGLTMQLDKGARHPRSERLGEQLRRRLGPESGFVTTPTRMPSSWPDTFPPSTTIPKEKLSGFRQAPTHVADERHREG